ncbi:right-handed parallel beta-helix repeat-containing protein [Kribbella solani]|uniref:right-handed parallel beta-helix repeat-containing protein n=1 Tax=Kribbella solani TaxID=236067 RepID=UPI0029A7D9F6|nr:right-handed parallel beta-helix repeat-containing protein [Kribbella solani]MDX2973898.1 right-handed parallel beta-helix repeat-containing protein [Kribbella solani]
MKTGFLAVVAVGTSLVAVGPLPATGSPAPDDLLSALLFGDTDATTPPSDGSFRTGPALAPACDGVTIKPSDDAARVITDSPPGTTFCFASGLHRIGETLRPKADQVLASDEGAVLTGSVRLKRWAANGGAWVTTGALPPAYAQTGQCEDNKANICYLAEQVFRDGRHLTRVASRDKVARGTFYADYAANAIYLGDDPAGHDVEMSSTPTAIEPGGNNVTVRGLTVEHFATPPQGGAVVLGLGWRVYANDIRWNHAVGAMLVNADNAVLEKNRIHHNGQLGVGQYSTLKGTIAANEVSDNNTDGFWIADWESGGIKTTWSSGGWVVGNLIADNLGVGLWSDAYDDRRTFSNNQIVDNAADGIRYEIGRNGVIADNTVSGNGFGTGRGSGTSLWDGGGINVNTSSNVQVRDNVVANNVNGISIQSRTRGSGPWGTNLLRNIVVSGNQVTMRGGTTATGMVQNSGAAIPDGTVTLNDNVYILDSLTTDRFQQTGQRYTAKQWQSTGQDKTSTFTTGRAILNTTGILTILPTPN